MTKLRLLWSVVGVMALVGVACTARPAPLSAQSPAQATPGAAAARAGAPPAAGPLVATAPAETGRVEGALSLSGNVASTQQTNLVPKTPGRIERVLVAVGDRVKTGQVLVQLDRAGLNAAAKQAEANLQGARARLKTVESGARPEDVEIARSQVAAAQARLKGMQAGRGEDVAAAAAALDGARARLQQLQGGARAADVETAEQGVAAARAALQKAEADLARLREGAKPDDLRVAELGLETARNSLWSQQISRDATCSRPSGGPCEAARAQVAAAETAVSQAQARLDAARRPADPKDVQTAAGALESARAALRAAEAKRTQLAAGPADEELRVARAAVVQAEQQLAKARQPVGAADVEAQRQQVVQAEQTLALRSTPYTTSDLETARAQVAQAEAALEVARVAAQEAAVTAPYDGVVTSLPLAEGSIVSAQAPAVVLASTQVEVVVNVEESRYGKVKPGQGATLTVSAFPGRGFPAEVVSAAPTVDTRTRTFPVKVRPVPATEDLVAGMFAEVRITTQGKDGVTTVPREAVVTRADRSVVFVLADGRVRQVDVTGGLVGDARVEAPTGLNPGDRVVVSGQSSLNDGDAARTAAA